jgi:hypothetical protein
MSDGRCINASARILVFALVLAASLAATSTRAESQAPANAQSSDSLFTTIARLDSAMFDAYNRCDLVTLATFFTEDLEFYHDQTGLSRGRQSLIDGVQKNICGKVRRDLVRGSLEVHPLKGYGAVETGEHMFCDPRVHPVCENATSGVAKFVTLWQLKDGTWNITRVISYDHVSSNKR